MSTRALSLREGIAPVRDRLMTTLFLAGLLHGILILGVTFGAVGADDRAPGLEVLIVSEDVPEAVRNDSAAYLAQRTQLGSGTSEDAIPVRSPAAERERAAQAGEIDGLSPEARLRAAMSEEALLASTARQPEVLYLADPGPLEGSDQRPLLVEERRGRSGLGQDDEPDVQIRGPQRDELWITPDTREAVLAPYLDAWRRKIERLGTLNFPAVARRSAATSNPVLEVAIEASGQLESAVIRRSSGSPELDQAALGILKLGSPFDPFPRELSSHYRVLRFAYEWQFVGGTVERGRVTAPADSR